MNSLFLHFKRQSVTKPLFTQEEENKVIKVHFEKTKNRLALESFSKKKKTLKKIALSDLTAAYKRKPNNVSKVDSQLDCHL